MVLRGQEILLVQANKLQNIIDYTDRKTLYFNYKICYGEILTLLFK